MNDAAIHALYLRTLHRPRAERAAAIRRFAESHGRAEDTVRKALKAHAAARGEGRPPRVGEALARAARVVARYKQTPDGRLRTEDAQRLALRDGALDRAHPVSSLDEAMRKLGLNTPAAFVRRMEAPHANFAHRVDVSGSRHFQVLRELPGGDWQLRVVRAEQRNKRWRDGQLLWLYAAIDDYSRVVACRYGVAPAENAEDVQDFLVWAWRESELRGLPTDMLLCDQGAFGKSATTAELLSHFGIRLEMGMPNNSQRNGRIERFFRPLKETFERAYLATHGLGAELPLSDLQAHLAAFVRDANGRPHPVRKQHTRREDWQRSIAFHGIRECPEDALRMAVYRETRKVSAEGWIALDGRSYALVDAPHGLRGRRVAVVYNRAGERVAVHDGRTYALRDAAPAVLGTYDHPDAAGHGPHPAARARNRAQPSGRPLYGGPDEGRAPTASPPLPPSRVVAPVPSSRPAARAEDPFVAPAPEPFGSLDDAVAYVNARLPRPLHVLVPDELQRRRITNQLRATLARVGLEREPVDTVCRALRADLYRHAIGG